MKKLLSLVPDALITEYLDNKSSGVEKTLQTRIEYIDASDLYVIPQHQRPLILAFLRKLINGPGFQEHLFHCVIVVKIKGKHVIVDHQHGAVLAMSKGYTKLPCIVFEGDEQLAGAIFRDSNTERKSLRTLERFKSEYFDNVHTAVRSVKFIEENGYRLPENSDDKSLGTFHQPHKVFEWIEQYSEQHVSVAFQWYRQIWGEVIPKPVLLEALMKVSTNIEAICAPYSVHKHLRSLSLIGQTPCHDRMYALNAGVFGKGASSGSPGVHNMYVTIMRSIMECESGVDSNDTLNSMLVE